MTNNENRILNNETSRTKGVDALSSNIEAAKAIASIVKTTLGPMGMDKMLIDAMGDSIITNDGVKILQEMEIEHPGAKLLVEVAKTQEIEVGDGTTSAVILAGELLERAQDLIKKKIHPTTIVRVFKTTSIEALKILENEAVLVDTRKEKVIRDICETAMTGKIGDLAKENLSEIIYRGISLVRENEGILNNRIKITKATGGNIEDSFIVSGIVLPKELANPNMPSKIENAKVLLVDFPLEVREIDNQAKVNINSVSEYEDFIESEQNYLKSLVYKIKEIGADVILCQKGIDDNISYFLAKEGIMAIRRCGRSDMEKLSYAIGKNIVSSYDDLNYENLGFAKVVKRREVLGENYIFVEGCQNPKAITLFLKASTSHVLDEVHRAVDDAIGDINSIIKSGKIVAGGGAIELELYRKLISFSKKFEGKEQLIIQGFANAFLAIPKVLIENSGFDEIDFIGKLISKHENDFSKSGINGFTGIIDDTIKEGIVEPINVKSQAIKSAVEVSAMILRIDDIIAAKKLKEVNEFNRGF